LQGFVDSNRIEKIKNDVGLAEPSSSAARAIAQ
jgi:hypothetical protein